MELKYVYLTIYRLFLSSCINYPWGRTHNGSTHTFICLQPSFYSDIPNDVCGCMEGWLRPHQPPSTSNSSGNLHYWHLSLVPARINNVALETLDEHAKLLLSFSPLLTRGVLKIPSPPSIVVLSVLIEPFFPLCSFCGF